MEIKVQVDGNHMKKETHSGETVQIVFSIAHATKILTEEN